ncbi:hypothetical protein HPB50_014815 [Hyalomma asiaticum]|uniref:Uncharacterized protein n=1 Tax=Hyalomma asiaticum TaxID=266040 RepID=A0ACB7SE28_HYAAI|nr:hypothetical protein HPB50_014815 [Hyalomma asiaticum]
MKVYVALTSETVETYHMDTACQTDHVVDCAICAAVQKLGCQLRQQLRQCQTKLAEFPKKTAKYERQQQSLHRLSDREKLIIDQCVMKANVKSARAVRICSNISFQLSRGSECYAEEAGTSQDELEKLLNMEILEAEAVDLDRTAATLQSTARLPIPCSGIMNGLIRMVNACGDEDLLRPRLLATVQDQHERLNSMILVEALVEYPFLTREDGTEAPVSYFSAAPWKRQERVHTAKGENHLFAPFRGRTIVDRQRKSNGTSLPPGPRSVFCECGVLLLHKSHKKSVIHRRRTGAQGDGAPMSDTKSATEAIVQRLRHGSRVRKVASHSGCGYSGGDHGGIVNTAEPPPQAPPTWPVTAAAAAPSSSPSDIFGSPASASPGTLTWSAAPDDDNPATTASVGETSPSST